MLRTCPNCGHIITEYIKPASEGAGDALPANALIPGPMTIYDPAPDAARGVGNLGDTRTFEIKR